MEPQDSDYVLVIPEEARQRYEAFKKRRRAEIAEQRCLAKIAEWRRSHADQP